MHEAARRNVLEYHYVCYSSNLKPFICSMELMGWLLQKVDELDFKTVKKAVDKVNNLIPPESLKFEI
ncbi:MAG: hypothetical protein PVF56_16135 [Desulfobacterales bacterium]